MKYSGDWLLDWLEQQAGVNLVNDDHGRWAISDAGTQPVPEDEPTDMAIVSFVDAAMWQPTIREAFEYYFKKNEVKHER